MKQIIILNGVARSGKDTFIDLFQEITCRSIIKKSTIDTVKSMMRLCGWKNTKIDKDRQFMSDLKNLIVDYNDFIFNDIVRYVNDAPDYLFIFVICREPEEIKRIQDHFKGSYSILIRNLNAEKNIPTNSADQNVFDYDYDFSVNNNYSLDVFRHNIQKFNKVIRPLKVAS